MRFKLTAIISTILVLGITAAAARECEPGVWDMTSLNFAPDGTTSSGIATTERRCFADGALQADEFRSIDEDGNPVFWGVSLQHMSDDREDDHILWVMVGDPGYTVIPFERNDDGSVTAGGQGFDATGSFLERSEMTFAEDGSYRFVMDRSYDGGDTWIAPYNIIEAQMTDREPGALPERLVPPIAEGATAAPDGPRGTPFLDGTAELRTFEHDGELVVQFASRYWEPNRWRIVEWVAGTGQVDAMDFPF